MEDTSKLRYVLNCSALYRRASSTNSLFDKVNLLKALLFCVSLTQQCLVYIIFLNCEKWIWWLLSDLRSCGTSMAAASCNSNSTNDMRARAGWPPCPNISSPLIGRPLPSPLLIGKMVLLKAEDLRIQIQRQMVRMKIVDLQYKPPVCVDVYSTHPGLKVCATVAYIHSWILVRLPREHPRNKAKEKLCSTDS